MTTWVSTSGPPTGAARAAAVVSGVHAATGDIVDGIHQAVNGDNQTNTPKTLAAVKANMMNIPPANIAVSNPTSEFSTTYSAALPFNTASFTSETSGTVATVTFDRTSSYSNCTIIASVVLLDSHGFGFNFDPIPPLSVNYAGPWDVLYVGSSKIDGYTSGGSQDRPGIVWFYQCSIGSTAQEAVFKFDIPGSVFLQSSWSYDWHSCGAAFLSAGSATLIPTIGPGVDALYISGTSSTITIPSGLTVIESTTVADTDQLNVDHLTLAYKSGPAAAIPSIPGAAVYVQPEVDVTDAVGVGGVLQGNTSILSTGVTATGEAYTVPYSGFYVGSVNNASSAVSILVSSTSQVIPLTTSTQPSGCTVFYAQAGDTVTFQGATAAEYTAIALASRSEL